MARLCNRPQSSGTEEPRHEDHPHIMQMRTRLSQSQVAVVLRPAHSDGGPESISTDRGGSWAGSGGGYSRSRVPPPRPQAVHISHNEDRSIG
jgi:hypothetical protein